MAARRAFSLIEVVFATLVLVAVVLAAAHASTRLIARFRWVSDWRAAAAEVDDLLRRFARAPCTLMPASPVDVRSGGIIFRWAVESDSGRLVAVRWPADAPVAVRRGALRSVLPCGR
ncbi:MAG: hypothetical protein ACO3F5_00980 [Gemmatimonadaceae bacterium]